ncbi:MAG: DF family (seleno)protein [Solirubrobacteraceae bacterium]
MKVEILYFEDCPNFGPLLSRVHGLFDSAGIDADVVTHAVESEAAACEQRFLGSPTVRIDGHDVEPGAGERSDYGLKCRLYRTAQGITGQPSDEWIMAAAQERLCG